MQYILKKLLQAALPTVKCYKTLAQVAQLIKHMILLHRDKSVDTAYDRATKVARLNIKNKLQGFLRRCCN